jgi:hypothetical protein
MMVELAGVEPTNAVPQTPRFHTAEFAPAICFDRSILMPGEILAFFPVFRIS